MRTILGWRSMALATCLLGFTSPGALNAAPDEPGTTPLERKALDEHIYKTLRDVINKGADLYNSGDQNGCYRLYEGALMALQPLLDHRPEMQKAITTGIEDARRNADLARRAFVLRDAIDKVRNDIHPKKPEDSGKPPAPGKTLWDRLGGEKNVTQVVDDFVEIAALDNKVNFDRGGKYPLPEEKIKHLKDMLVQLISANTGGPIKKYTGKDMKTVHEGMGITDAQFDALAADLKKALEKNGAKAEDAKALLEIVEKTRIDIVEKPPKPQEDKKEGDKKEDADEKTTVSGKITFKGVPLSEGTIAFHLKEKSISTNIAADGTYDLIGIKPGTYKIAIGQGAKPTVVIPKKYGDPETSGLQITVVKGKQLFDLDLK
jgi:hemoglobin